MQAINGRNIGPEYTAFLVTKVRFCGLFVESNQRETWMTMELVRRYGAWLFQLHQLAVQGRVYPRSARVSLLVGTVLNLINQPEWLFGMAPLHPFKFLFTYLVPFLVATYGAVAVVQARACHGRDHARPEGEQ